MNSTFTVTDKGAFAPVEYSSISMMNVSDEMRLPPSKVKAYMNQMESEKLRENCKFIDEGGGKSSKGVPLSSNSSGRKHKGGSKMIHEFTNYEVKRLFVEPKVLGRQVNPQTRIVSPLVDRIPMEPHVTNVVIERFDWSRHKYEDLPPDPPYHWFKTVATNKELTQCKGNITSHSQQRLMNPPIAVTNSSVVKMHSVPPQHQQLVPRTVQRPPPLSSSFPRINTPTNSSQNSFPTSLSSAHHQYLMPSVLPPTSTGGPPLSINPHDSLRHNTPSTISRQTHVGPPLQNQAISQPPGRLVCNTGAGPQTAPASAVIATTQTALVRLSNGKIVRVPVELLRRHHSNQQVGGGGSSVKTSMAPSAVASAGGFSFQPSSVTQNPVNAPIVFNNNPASFQRPIMSSSVSTTTSFTPVSNAHIPIQSHNQNQQGALQNGFSSAAQPQSVLQNAVNNTSHQHPTTSTLIRYVNVNNSSSSSVLDGGGQTNRLLDARHIVPVPVSSLPSSSFNAAVSPFGTLSPSGLLPPSMRPIPSPTVMNGSDGRKLVFINPIVNNSHPSTMSSSMAIPSHQQQNNHQQILINASQPFILPTSCSSQSLSNLRIIGAASAQPPPIRTSFLQNQNPVHHQLPTGNKLIHHIVPLDKLDSSPHIPHIFSNSQLQQPMNVFGSGGVQLKMTPQAPDPTHSVFVNPDGAVVMGGVGGAVSSVSSLSSPALRFVSVHSNGGGGGAAILPGPANTFMLTSQLNPSISEQSNP